MNDMDMGVALIFFAIRKTDGDGFHMHGRTTLIGAVSEFPTFAGSSFFFILIRGYNPFEPKLLAELASLWDASGHCPATSLGLPASLREKASPTDSSDYLLVLDQEDHAHHAQNSLQSYSECINTYKFF